MVSMQYSNVRRSIKIFLDHLQTIIKISIQSFHHIVVETIARTGILCFSDRLRIYPELFLITKETLEKKVNSKDIMINE